MRQSQTPESQIFSPEVAPRETDVEINEASTGAPVELDLATLQKIGGGLNSDAGPHGGW